MRAFRYVPLATSLFGLALAVACGEEAPPPPEEGPPIVGILEVPISFRNDGPNPSDAARIEINQQELHLNGRPVMTLTRGRAAPAERSADGGLTKVLAAVHAAPARSRATITAHSLVGYGTLVRTVQSLTSAGYRDISLAVRPLTTGTPPSSFSWIAISSPTIAPAGGAMLDPATYPNGTSRQWSEFTSHWQEAYDACRDPGPGRYIDCDIVPLATPEDGFLQVVLWTREQGMQIRFNRVGAPPPPDPMEEAMRRPRGLIAGVGAPRSGEGEEVPPTPATEGTFSFRADVATTEESAISNMSRPICGTAPCPVVIEADEETPVMRVLSLFGAMFPNGTPMPTVVMRLPQDPVR
jgi:hypothetical protein